MARIITVSVKEKDKELWETFKKIAEREGGVSKVIITLVEDYVKKHGSGNPSFPLDRWSEKPEFLPFPTLGEPPQTAYLVRLDKEMLQKIKEHAQSYADKASILLKELERHKDHERYGIKDEFCTYCKFG